MWDLCSHTGSHDQEGPRLGLMVCCCNMTLSNCIFEPVFYKWSSRGHRNLMVSRGDLPHTRFPHSCRCPMSSALMHLHVGVQLVLKPLPGEGLCYIHDWKVKALKAWRGHTFVETTTCFKHSKQAMTFQETWMRKEPIISSVWIPHVSQPFMLKMMTEKETGQPTVLVLSPFSYPSVNWR